MNLWRRRSLNQNPYYRTAFRAARVPRECTRHKVVVGLISQTRRIVTLSPQNHVIRGEQVTTSELNDAEQVLLDADKRIVEELLHHATELPPLNRVRELSAEVIQAIVGPTEGLPNVTNLSGLRLLVDHFVNEFIATSNTHDPSFGALELELTPPFGPLGDE